MNSRSASRVDDRTGPRGRTLAGAEPLLSRPGGPSHSRGGTRNGVGPLRGAGLRSGGDRGGAPGASEAGAGARRGRAPGGALGRSERRRDPLQDERLAVAAFGGGGFGGSHRARPEIQDPEERAAALILLGLSPDPAAARLLLGGGERGTWGRRSGARPCWPSGTPTSRSRSRSSGTSPCAIATSGRWRPRSRFSWPGTPTGPST